MKIKEFNSMLQTKKADFALFYTSDSARVNPNLFYFSHYSGIGALVVPKNKQPFIIAPDMELERAKKSGIGKAYPMEKKRFFESVLGIVRKNRIKTNNIAIDKNNFTLNSYRYFKKQFRKAKIKDIAPDCAKLRETKTRKEIECLRKSCAYADRILQKAIKSVKELKTESNVAAFLEYEAKKIGLELSFNPIVASGSNGSMPHYEPRNIKLKEGFCVLDFGVKYKGYCSDITRTICIGKPNKKEKEIYNMLLAIQEGVILQIKNNKKCSELYDYVAGKLGKYKGNFTHGLGHGVGVEIHELPNLTLNSKDRIKDNMVFTIEPGVYFPNRFGIRIEDTLLFNGRTYVLTRTSKDLLIV